jgi:UDP-N-acetylglucosamine 3-dehydrogenase
MFRVGIIGCGRPWKTEGATGMGIANWHALGYEASPDAEIVALCDLNLDAAQAFQASHGGERIYRDYQEMLTEESLDIVSVCTPVQSHPEIVIAAAKAGVKAVHCEKPMANTYGDSVRMVQVCEERGVQLTINCQRRFGNAFVKAKELLKAGAIGKLTEVGATCPDLFGWGVHYFDMLFFYNDDTPVDWVIGQIDARGGRERGGHFSEGQGISYFKFRTGVHGLLVTGHQAGLGGEYGNRLIGTEGIMEVFPTEEIPLRIWGKGQGQWEVLHVQERNFLPENFVRAVLDLIDALKTGREPQLSAQRALQATEVMFATYESSRRRGRVDLPLDIEDSPLDAMVASGQIAV